MSYHWANLFIGSVLITLLNVIEYINNNYLHRLMAKKNKTNNVPFLKKWLKNKKLKNYYKKPKAHILVVFVVDLKYNI